MCQRILFVCEMFWVNVVCILTHLAATLAGGETPLTSRVTMRVSPEAQATIRGVRPEWQYTVVGYDNHQLALMPTKQPYAKYAIRHQTFCGAGDNLWARARQGTV